MAYAIKKGSDYFTTVLYTGDFSTNRTISVPTLTPDLTWIKARNTVDTHVVYDTVRQGLVGPGSRLRVDTTDAESDLGDYVDLVTNGFKVSTGTYNNDGVTYAAWNWKAGGTAVTNTDGSITSQVSANPTSRFSVVTYTGNGTSGSVGHGLGNAPKVVLIKNRTTAGTDWVFFTTLVDGSMDYLFLDTTAAKADASESAPTSTTFNVASSSPNINADSNNYVAYCWSEVEGFSKFGSYTGNGSADGPFVYTGFRPAFVMFKRTDATGHWYIYDSTRDTYNVIDKYLIASLDNTEGVAVGFEFDYLSNGIKLRGDGAAVNASGGTYIYMAFAETPFKFANAR